MGRSGFRQFYFFFDSSSSPCSHKITTATTTTCVCVVVTVGLPHTYRSRQQRGLKNIQLWVILSGYEEGELISE